MATLRNQISSFILMYIALPLGVLLLLLNFQFWNVLTSHNDDRINHLAEDSVQALNNEITTQLNRLEELADSPATTALLTSKKQSNTTTEKWDLKDWLEEVGQAQENNISEGQARLTEFNPVSDQMKHLVDRHAAIGRVQITDLLGTVQAANFKVSQLKVNTTPWWRTALAKKGAFQYEGLDDNGRFWATKAIMKKNIKAPLGVLRIEILLEGLVKELKHPLPYKNTGIAVRGHGEEFYFTHGNPKVIETFADKTVRRVILSYKESGWYHGVRFKQLYVADQFDMKNKPRVLSFIEEAFIPHNQLVKIGLSSLSSILLLLLVILLARRSGLRLGEGTSEILAAGNLLLHKMKNEAGAAPLPQSIKGALFKKVETRFNTWLKNFRQSVLDNVETHQYETERDQELATDFQLAYLNRPYPAIPTRTSPGRLKLNFHHQYQPALALGGDFFEISQLAPDVAGVFISDVMGHGTRSALITSSLRTLINDNLSQGRNARLFMTEINKGFCKLLSGIKMQHPLFASAYFFVADVTARAATFSTAGHPAPIHINRQSNHVSRLEVSKPHGAALGINPQEEYTGGSCRLAAGDVFIFYTDGVYEAFNAYGQEFGMEQLEKNLRNLMHNSLQEIIDGLLQAVTDFTGNEPLQDDICILGVEVSEG